MFLLPSLLTVAVGLGLATADPLWPGYFSIPRLPSSCAAVTATPLQVPAAADNCLLYRSADLWQPAAHHVTYVRDGERRRYRLSLATLSVEGGFAGHDLSFHCPAEEYYGTPPIRCLPGLQAAVLHVGANDRLYGIDVVQSPAAYPPLDRLAAHRSPFGVAQFRFPAGVPLRTAEYLQVCLQATPSAVCGSRPAVAAVPPFMPFGHVGVGRVTLAGSDSAPSEIIVDPANQLMATAAGDRRYFFNSAGFFVSEAATCTHSSAKTFASQQGAYDARFLDHVGTVTVVARTDRPRFTPVRVAVWVGVAFDAAGIQPVVLYADAATGAQHGMDVVEVAPAPEADSMAYWYDTVAPAVPGVSILEFAQRAANAGDPCAHAFHHWLHPNATRTCPLGLVLRGGFCRSLPSGRPPQSPHLALYTTATTQLEAAAPLPRWAMPTAAGLAVVVVLALLVPGTLKTVVGWHAPCGSSVPSNGYACYKTFETP